VTTFSNEDEIRMKFSVIEFEKIEKIVGAA